MWILEEVLGHIADWRSIVDEASADGMHKDTVREILAEWETDARRIVRLGNKANAEW